MKKLSLIEMIQFAILSEGRAEDVLRKYENQGVTKEIIDKFVQGQNDIDPAINNKYLEWMVQQYLNNKNTNEIINAVNTWYKNLNKIDSTLISNHYPDWITNKELLLIAKNPKDINSYKTLDILQNIGRYAEKKLSKNEEEKIIKAETRLVYDDNNFQIRVPLSIRPLVNMAPVQHGVLVFRILITILKNIQNIQYYFMLLIKKCHQGRNIQCLKLQFK